jgi:manganese transport protein
MFTASKSKMGEFVIPKWFAAVAWLIAIIICGLNAYLLLGMVF